MSARARARIKSQPGFVESVTTEKYPVVEKIHMIVFCSFLLGLVRCSPNRKAALAASITGWDVG